MNRLLGLAIAAAVAAADQLSKTWIASFLADAPAGRGQSDLTAFFSLVLVRNRGMSFGLFNDDSPWNVLLFSLLAAAIVTALVIWLWRTQSKLSASIVGLVTGGAIGNVIDRLRLGAVVDFLDFHWGDWHFPAFNLADSAITVGAALFLIDGLLKGRESRN